MCYNQCVRNLGGSAFGCDRVRSKTGACLGVCGLRLTPELFRSYFWVLGQRKCWVGTVCSAAMEPVKHQTSQISLQSSSERPPPYVIPGVNAHVHWRGQWGTGLVDACVRQGSVARRSGMPLVCWHLSCCQGSSWEQMTAA